VREDVPDEQVALCVCEEGLLVVATRVQLEDTKGHKEGAARDEKQDVVQQR
jgi:hypothetical protein